jgi:transketolase
MRQTALDMVYELARHDERIVFVGSDLGVGTLDAFRRDMPERFFMEGVSEAHIVSMAAGLAREGYIVYVNTIATFLTRRCLEQIAIDLCHHEANVRLIANGGGVVYGPLGATHLAIDDFGMLRCLPHMTIVAPADADEMRRFMPLSVDHSGPIYIRLGRGHDPIVTPKDQQFRIGSAYRIRDGADVLAITTGVTLRAALSAAERLAADKVSLGVLHVPTVKPLDVAAVRSACQKVRLVITVEEHNVIGGLGSAVAEVLAEGNTAAPLRRIGIPDTFPELYGAQQTLLDHFDINADGIVNVVRSALG